MDIKPIYLFYGEETYLLQKAVTYFRSYFGAEGVVAENFDGSKVSLGEIIAAAEEIPLFGGKRLIIVSGAPWFSKAVKKGEDQADAPEPDGTALLEYAKAPNEDTCLIFIAAKADKRMKTVKAVESVGTVRSYETKKSYELPDYIRKYMAQRHKTIAPHGLDLLLALVGENLGILSSEMDKLVLLVGDRDRVTEEDVRRVASHSAEATSFLLSDAVGMRRLGKVQEYASSILENTKPGDYAMLFGYLTNYFRLLLRIKDLAGRGKGEKAIAKELGIHVFRVKKGMEAEKKYTMAELIEAMAEMLNCDYRVKSGRWEYGEGLYVTLLKIVSGAKNPAVNKG